MPSAPEPWAALTRTWALRPSNPSVLMRPCDRFEEALRIVAVLAVALLVPIAGALGTTVYTDTAAAVRTEHATRSTVEAEIASVSEATGVDSGEARVVWKADGRSGEAQMPVAASASAGDRITLWIDEHGTRVDPPRDSGAAATAGVTTALTVLLLGAAGAWCTVCAVSWALSRRRNTQWDKEWRAVTGIAENSP
ncbi:Rv1733c family protein [Nocardia carnea]|uniref:Transmembrane protein n=1 Tax=Nocardia carnea TaxID=37328 RepID=A0ABW7THK9_9NOCA|nr:hypothetical protein [Nocardia carnea]